MVFQRQLTLQTRGHGDVHDLTAQVNEVVRASGVRTGIAHVFAVDVSGDVDVRPSDRFTSIGPFDDRVSAGMDLYDLFIDRRQQPDLMLAGYRAARDALSPFTRRPAAHGGRRREATRS